jgi:glyoxylase-like metal-dependent hydrolase (beta-lactamase superfamily II)
MGLSFEDVTESVVLAQNDYGSNLVCVALEDELVFVDAGLHTGFTAEFRRAMEERFGLKASTLIMTHAHIDHLLGIGAFSDCDVVAAEAGMMRFERFLAAEYTEETIQSAEMVFPHFRESIELAKLSMPTTWVKDRMVLGGGDVVFQLVGGHSSCSSSIHVIPERVIIAGDLMQVDRTPYFGEPDTDIVRWVWALKTWEDMDIDTVVPGHGGTVDLSYVARVRVFFEEMLEALRSLKEEGVPLDEIAHHPRLPSGYWPVDAERKPTYDFSINNLYKRL